MTCRICGSVKVSRLGEVEYYSGYAWPVYDCRECLCRFTRHDDSTYDTLHRDSGTCYDVYRLLQERCTQAFVNRDLDGLRYELAQNSKYKFIIEGVERGSRNASLLEIGCSRGYLTSYFILAGYNIIGVDVSESALAFARAAFGDYFAMRGDSVVTDRAPYDVIYHVGTIGCVSDPLGLTRQLLSMLKPGGRLLFNSPNLQSCWLTNQLWIDAAPPPDLVAIFPPGFWARCFADQAYVEEQIEHCDPNKGLSIGLRKLFGRKWKCPLPIPLDKSSELYLKGSNGTALNGHRPRIGDEAWRFFERAVLKVCRDTGLLRHVRKEPSEFGLFVSMTR